MDDCDRAIEILKRARDLLAERLAERVLQAHEEILADALGLSYTSEIESIYEQIGSRLHHLNAMLSSLPAQTRPASDAPCEPQPSRELAPRVAFALPAPRPAAGLLALEPPVSLQTFVLQIQAGAIAAAGRTLAELFDLDPLRAAGCARTFYEKHQRQGNVLAKTLQLQQLLSTDQVNRSLLLLYECFELYGGELVSVMQRLKARLAAA